METLNEPEMATGLKNGLLELRRLLATEVGSEEPCPWCGEPRVKRTDYIRCNRHGTNWLDEERHLSNYLDRNPAAARMDVVRLKFAATSEADANAIRKPPVSVTAVAAEAKNKSAG